MSTTAKNPILIAGAGPTGLILALTLAKNGVPIRIVEKDTQYHVGQRGPGIQPRTLEIFRFLGVLDEIAKAGGPMVKRCSYEMPEGRKPARIFDMIPAEEPTPSVPYRNPILIGQSRNEAILRAHVQDCGVQVELGTELVGFEQDDTGVIAHLVKRTETSEVSEAVPVSYLIGADSAKSIVRKQLGLSFEGETREADRLIIVDVEVQGIGNEYWHSWGDNYSSAVHMRPTEDEGIFSIMIFGRDVDYALLLKDQEALFSHLKKVTNRSELEFGEVKWMTEWRPNIRMADKFGEGRVFIAGDAAHVHPPTGAQGLNSGAQDSFNLAWKLALVHKGLASPALLETYTTERVPIIADMLGRTTAVLNQTIQKQSDPAASTHGVRPKILHQLGVNCRWSPIVVDEQPEAQDVKNVGAYLAEDPTLLYAGDRAPEAPGLLVVGSAEAETTSLFGVFGPAHHTVLVFATTAKDTALVLRGLDGYPADIVKKVAILPKVAAQTAVLGADLTLVDQQGYAHEGYPPVAKGYPVVVVRPDGVVGAVVKGADGIQQYFGGVFVSVRD